MAKKRIIVSYKGYC